MGTSQTRYTAEFKAEAVKQVVERGRRVSDVANRLGVSKWSLHQCGSMGVLGVTHIHRVYSAPSFRLFSQRIAGSYGEQSWHASPRTAEIERLKEAVPVARLVEASGIELKKGGKDREWRWFPGDKWHNPKWDHNPHNGPSSPWVNVPHGGLPPVKP